MKEFMELMLKKNKKIATMESCTGGGLANIITNIEGASEVFQFGAVTYSNEYKIKMGVPEEVINTYTVYSMETADAMAKAISTFTNSDYGVGVTGKLNRQDSENRSGKNDVVYISIYNKETNQFSHEILTVEKQSREENKQDVLACTTKILMDVINRGDD